MPVKMFRHAFLAAAACLAAACSGDGSTVVAPAIAARVPTSATIGPEGFATILDAPPAPFTPAAPAMPQPPTAEQIAGQEQFRRVAEFQNAIRDEVQALADRLRVAEKGNFVDLYFENEGEPSVVFQFLRDGAATLRKYSSNPHFVAETVRFSNEQLLAAMDYMLETFREDRVIESGGIGAGNAVTIRINVPEQEFRALVARKGVTIPPEVRLEFPVQRSAEEINAPLPAEIASLIRIFPRDDRPAGALHSINSRAKVVLRDGCFRIAGGGDDGALVLFPIGDGLFIDSAGYLAFGKDERPGYARVGETIVTPGSIGEVTAPELVGPIHAACGTAKVVKIHGMDSAAAEGVQERVSTNAGSLRQLKEMYGLSGARALKAFEACKESFGFGTCVLSPPPPVARQEDCPDGTTLSFGLCRTPEGYIRPLPKWIGDLIDN